MGKCEIELDVLCRASKLTFTVKLPTIRCILVTCNNNGFSKRILDESLASITPYFRQASMKRAARSKCLMLSGRWKEEKKDTERRRWEGPSETSIVPALMPVFLQNTSTLSSSCLSNSLRAFCCQKHLGAWAVKEGGPVFSEEIDAEVRDTGTAHTLHCGLSFSVIRKKRTVKVQRLRTKNFSARKGISF